MLKRILVAVAATTMLIGAARAQEQKPAAGGSDAAIIQDIYSCLAPSLPPGWKKAWVTVVELDRSVEGKSRRFEAIFRHSLKLEDKEGVDLNPCDTALVIKGIGDLNEYLKPEQRNWTEAILTYTSDGKYEMKYGYAAPKPQTKTKPGAKPAAKASGAKPQ